MGALFLPAARPLAVPRITFPAGLVGAFVAIAGGLMALSPATDPDIGWHLRSGELILETHAIPRADPYSFTMRGAAWVEHEWLWQVAAAAIHNASGNLGMIAANALLVSVALLLVYLRLRLRKVAPMFAGLGAGAAMGLLIIPSGLRPAMVIVIMSAIYLLAFEAYDRQRDWRLLVLLLPCQVVWANSHGSYVIGPLLCGIYGAAALWQAPNWRSLLPWGGLGGALLAVSLVNPFGAGLLRFTLFASRLPVNRLFVAEWQAPNLSSWSAAPLGAGLVLSLALGFLMRGRWANNKAQLVLLVGASLGSLWSNQFVVLYAICAAPVLAEMLYHLLGQPQRARLSGVSGVALLATLGAVLLAGPVQRLSAERYQAALEEAFPTRAATFIEHNRLDGPMFNEFNWGGYLVRALPRLPVFVDGRTEVYGETFMEQYRDVAFGRQPPADTFQRYGINLVLVMVHGPLAAEMRQDSGWREAYRDELAAVFVHS